jgi:lipopolysaccharide biosynthesis protein
MRNFYNRLSRSVQKRTIGLPPKIKLNQQTVIEPDIVLSLPFRFDMAKPEAPVTVAVMLHAYYIDEVPRICDLLRNIPFQFSTFVTTDTEDKANQLRSIFSDWPHGPVEILIVENRGRDIAPRFVNLRSYYRKFEYVLHIHSKKSLHNPKLKAWGSDNLQDLLGNSEIVKSIFCMFFCAPKLGIVAPRYFPYIRNNISWGRNFDNCSYLAKKMNFCITSKSNLDFPAGSMFWARTTAIEPLLRLNLTTTDFDAEKFQVDGTLAHAIERLVFYSSELAGYDWLFVTACNKLESYERLIQVRSQSQIDSDLAANRRSLFSPRRPK